MKRFRQSRFPADGQLHIETPAGLVFVQVVDVNAYGMRLCGEFDLDVGDDLTATLASWEVSGVVRWVRRPYCGIMFDTRAPETAIIELRGMIGMVPQGFQPFSAKNML